MSARGWRFAAASVAGTSHERSGAPCQDAHLVEWIGAEGDEDPEGGVLVLIASDGAGSAAHSEEGSALACARLMDEVKGAFREGLEVSHITREVALRWLAEVQGALRGLAEEREVEVREFACTLLAAVVSASHAAFLQVGDGAMVVRPAGDMWSYVFWPQHGQFINTTHFITEATAGEVLECDVTEGALEEIAVFTDGIESLVLHFATQTVHGRFFDDIFGPVRALESSGVSEALSSQLGKYLALPHVCERTDDDKTLILATRAVPGEVKAAEVPSEVKAVPSDAGAVPSDAGAVAAVAGVVAAAAEAEAEDVADDFPLEP